MGRLTSSSSLSSLLSSLSQPSLSCSVEKLRGALVLWIELLSQAASSRNIDVPKAFDSPRHLNDRSESSVGRRLGASGRGLLPPKSKPRPRWHSTPSKSESLSTELAYSWKMHDSSHEEIGEQLEQASSSSEK